jgi:trimethylamine---corrinoid protein Co-methyltransferase
MMRGFEVDDATLALGAIREVGIGDIYLGPSHTLNHFREMWLPRLLSWDSRIEWQAAGATALSQRVNARTIELIDTHEARPVPDDVQTAMHEVIDARRRTVAASSH